MYHHFTTSQIAISLHWMVTTLRLIIKNLDSKYEWDFHFWNFTELHWSWSSFVYVEFMGVMSTTPQTIIRGLTFNLIPFLIWGKMAQSVTSSSVDFYSGSTRQWKNLVNYIKLFLSTSKGVGHFGGKIKFIFNNSFSRDPLHFKCLRMPNFSCLPSVDRHCELFECQTGELRAELLHCNQTYHYSCYSGSWHCYAGTRWACSHHSLNNTYLNFFALWWIVK